MIRPLLVLISAVFVVGCMGDTAHNTGSVMNGSWTPGRTAIGTGEGIQNAPKGDHSSGHEASGAAHDESDRAAGEMETVEEERKEGESSPSTGAMEHGMGEEINAQTPDGQPHAHGPHDGHDH